MVCVGRDLTDHLVLTPLQWAGWGTNSYVTVFIKNGTGITMLYKITSFNNDIVSYIREGKSNLGCAAEAWFVRCEN